jgi:small subunit ribosomal protein S6
MRTYEAVLLVNPDLDEEALNGVVDRVKNWMTESGGTITKVDMWGKRRMAYLIQKQREANYVLIVAELDPSSTAELERNLRFLEPVMRFMLTVNK